jgi:predicted DNA-binding transcriptional regulator YafY
VLETSARLLRLLSLLQARREWSGAELAERLEVSARTVRRDVDRLRSLGYPVDAAQGTAGYRLGAGAALPPLLLDDDEAVAVAVGLRTAASGAVAGIEETSLRALAKIEQVLPSRLRHRVNALQKFIVPVARSGPTVEASVLTAITAACRDHEQLRFDYADNAARKSVRKVEPHRLVSWGRRWYLVAWDTERQDWRTFRAERVRLRTPNGPRFVPRELPEPDAAAYVAKRISTNAWPLRARVTLHTPAEVVAERVWPGFGVVEALDEHTCVLDVAADSYRALALFIGFVDSDFEVSEPPELVEVFRRLAARYAAAGAG